MLDTHSHLRLAFNARELFAMCSTFKLMLVAALLKRVEAYAVCRREVSELDRAHREIGALFAAAVARQ